MKQKTLITAFLITGYCLLFSSYSHPQGVSINTSGNPANPSAGFEIDFNNKGFLCPRMTTVQRDAITSPAEALFIFNTTTKCFEAFVNGAWYQVSCPPACTPPAAPLAQAASNIACTSFTANWVASAGAVSYYLDVAADTGFTSFATGYNNLNVGGVTSFSVTGLTAGSAYYFRVRAFNACVSGNSNTIGPVTIASAPIVAPTAGTNTSSQTQIVWNWNTVSGASGYKYNTINDYGTATDNGAATSYTQTGLTCNTACILYVWAYNTCGNSPPDTLTQTTSACCSDQWTQKADFGSTGRNDAVGFSIGTKGYIGTGYDGGYKKDFWEWDQATDTWTQKADFGGTARYQAVGFSIGMKGYIGTGYDGVATGDFWEWDQATNTWVQKASFGAGVRYAASGFSMGTKGYIGIGTTNGFTYFQDFWEWDQATDSWLQKADFSGGLTAAAVSFSIGSKGYFGTGTHDQTNGISDFWEWDQATNTWVQKANFGGTGRYYAAGFSIGAKGYIGTGFTTSSGSMQDFWEWDQSSNTWSQKANFGGTGRYSAVGFSVGAKGYIGTGDNGKKDFWEYCP